MSRLLGESAESLRKNAIKRLAEAESLFQTGSYSIKGLALTLGCSVSYSQTIITKLLRQQKIMLSAFRERTPDSDKPVNVYKKYVKEEALFPKIIKAEINVESGDADTELHQRSIVNIPEHCDLMKAFFGLK